MKPLVQTNYVCSETEGFQGSGLYISPSPRYATIHLSHCGQRAIALVLKLLDLGKVCQDLVLNLWSKFKVRDDTFVALRAVKSLGI